jgi:hypothetical protein
MKAFNGVGRADLRTGPLRKRRRHNMKALKQISLNWMFAPLLALAMAFSHGGASAQGRPAYAFTQQELDQMLAPVALYPDALLSQVLMAATYPLEVVEAARWSNARPNLSGDAAVRAAERENWDPSVKSLLAFPQILGRMNEDLQWTQALGDAFLDQEGQVMDTVQELRHRAQIAGNLRSDERLRVIDNGLNVTVQFYNPQVAYLPYYDPMVVYGSWWWPSHPPVVWRPWAGYYARPGYARGFYWGSPVGISVGFFFGEFDWRQRQVRVVEVSNFYYNTVTVNRTVVVDQGPRAWHHEPEHRRGVAYRSPEVQQRVVERAQPDRRDRAGVDTRRPDARFDARRPETRAETRTGADARVIASPVQAAQPVVRDTDARNTDARNDGHRPDARTGVETRAEPADSADRPGQTRPEWRSNRQQARPEPSTRLEVPRQMAAPTVVAHAETVRVSPPRVEARAAPPATRPAANANTVAHHDAKADAAARRESGDDAGVRREPNARGRSASPVHAS